MTAHAFDILDYTDARTAARGRAYFNQGNVVALEGSPEQGWEARVRGSDGRAYRTRVNIVSDTQRAQSRFASDCTCPVAVSCKHFVAVMMALGDAVDITQDTQNAAREQPDWLDALGAELVAAPEALPAPVPVSRRRSLAYRVAPAPAARGQTLVEAVVTLGKVQRSQHGFSAVIPFETLNDNYDFINAEEPHAQVATLMRLITPQQASWHANYDYETVHCVSHTHLPTLMRAMVLTGTCFWHGNRTPLSWGSERATGLQWCADNDGRQRLGLDLPSQVRVLCGVPAVYIDTHTNTAGWLRHAIPSAVLRTLDASPRLELEAVAAFCDRLTGALRDVIPPPAQLVRQERRLTPQPVLRLSFRDADADTSPELVGEVMFDYGGRQVPRDGAAADVCFVEGHTLVSIPRQLEQEAQLAAQLAARCQRPVSPPGAPAVCLGPVGTMQAAASLVDTKLAALRQSGWRIEDDALLPHTVVHAEAPVAMEVASDPKAHWFDLKMTIEVDGARVDLAHLMAEALQRPEIGLCGDLRLLGPTVYLPLDERRVVAMPTHRLVRMLGILQELHSGASLGLGHAVEVLSLLDTGDCTVRGDAFVFKLARRLQACEGARPVRVPASLQARLRPYQQHGVNWLNFLREYKLGGLLADDMGLGKTLQTLTHLARVHAKKANAPSLVVAPTSLLFNWRAEAERFVPKLRLRTYHGPQRDLGALSDVDVVITSYGTLVRDSACFTSIAWDTVVLDESHVIKNPRTRLHHAVRALRVDHRVCLSGTPLQNNLEELWAQFAFLTPDLLDDHRSFNERFVRPIEKHDDAKRRAQLAARIRPFVLRRAKADVAAELPAKTEIVQKLEIVGAQRDLYESVRNAMDTRVRKIIDGQGLERSSIVVLDALLKLRQVCCDPRLVKLETARGVSGSAKLDRLLELVETLAAQNRRILVFSQFTSMLTLIADALTQRKIAHLTLTGKTQDRQGVVQAFQTNVAPVFLLSLKAGGVGLNLAAADTVIHYDPWWNPAAENQATDRAHRIGQDKPVFVYKLIVAGSVEEKILQMQHRKLALTQRVLEGGAMARQLTRADLDNLLAPLGNA